SCRVRGSLETAAFPRRTFLRLPSLSVALILSDTFAGVNESADARRRESYLCDSESDAASAAFPDALAALQPAGPHQHQFRGTADERRLWLHAVRVRTGGGHFLYRLFPVRSAEQPSVGSRRRTAVAGAHHDQVGTRGNSDGLDSRRGIILCVALSARGRRGRPVTRCVAVPESLGAAPALGSGLLDSDGDDRARQRVGGTDRRLAPAVRWPGGSARLAAAVHRPRHTYSSDRH